MSESRIERLRSADRRLHSVLVRWADTRRLSVGQIDALRQHVVAESASGDFDWWWRLLDPDGGLAFRGLAAVPAWEPSLAAGAVPFQPATVWPTSASMLPIWDHDEADFQPYLRLT
jgi:hypothetical protein